jgi:hypothetical protein
MKTLLSRQIFPLLLLSFALAAISLAAPKAKYGPDALVLSAPSGHSYFKNHSAPDFWVLMPFYAAQVDESACSVASVQMLVNAAREAMRTPLSSDDELATQPKLVERVKHSAWHAGIPGALAGHGVTLDELGEIAKEALESYGLKVASVEVNHADDTSALMLKKLHSELVSNEKYNRDFILINFSQGVYTGDADVGHIAPIGAYDETKQRVLVLDPDRHWYEPYWVTEKVLLAGMATRDSQSKKNRGWIYIKLATEK